MLSRHGHDVFSGPRRPIQPMPGVMLFDTTQPYVFRLRTVPRLSCLPALTAGNTSRGCPFIMQRAFLIHQVTWQQWQ